MWQHPARQPAQSLCATHNCLTGGSEGAVFRPYADREHRGVEDREEGGQQRQAQHQWQHGDLGGNHGVVGMRQKSIGSSRHQRLLRRSEEHTSELQSQSNLVCRLLLEKKKKKTRTTFLSSYSKEQGTRPS